VSPNYAREIQTEEFGCGLEGLLGQRKATLTGILNGVDYEEWNTTKNPHLANPYSFKNLRGKQQEKVRLQAQLGLPQNPNIPMFGSVTRLAEQKGIITLIGALKETLDNDIQFVSLGSGEKVYEDALKNLARTYPNKVSATMGYNHSLAHQIEAASDFFLMPSRFEPCGLNQMYSLRYGTIPIVRATGGLEDSVIDISKGYATATGIKFQKNHRWELAKAIYKALVLYQNTSAFKQVRQNGMKADFSWDETVVKYENVYQKLIG
jgi:starch synthase